MNRTTGKNECQGIIHLFCKIMHSLYCCDEFLHGNQCFGSIHISTPQTQLGNEESTLSSETEGQENKIALSSSYCLDFLSHVEAEEIEICVHDSMHPAVFKI